MSDRFKFQKNKLEEIKTVIGLPTSYVAAQCYQPKNTRQIT
jgi:hypothetical protein